jgi:DNA (cytosine-5)-methyltransferase 1
MLTFLAIAERYKPKWIVWENVPGVLSSNGGKDFGSFLGALGELGYGWAYRVLDAQWFGVAQRRKRVFVVGCLGDQRAAAEVLFESESVSRNPAPSREKRQAVTGAAEESARSGKWWDGGDTSATLTTRSGGQYMPDKDNFQAVIQPNVAHAFKIHGGSPTETGEYGGTPGKAAGKGYLGSDELAFTLAATQDQQIAFRKSKRAQSADDHETWVDDGVSNTLNNFDVGDARTTHAVVAVDTYNYTTNDQTTQTIRAQNDTEHIGAIMNPPMAIRRLTPVECERLQGFPDNWTKIPWKKKPAEDCPDGPRYKACGNSMAVPVMRWIGQRINKKTDHL